MAYEIIIHATTTNKEQNWDLNLSFSFEFRLLNITPGKKSKGLFYKVDILITVLHF